MSGEILGETTVVFVRFSFFSFFLFPCSRIKSGARGRSSRQDEREGDGEDAQQTAGCAHGGKCTALRRERGGFGCVRVGCRLSRRRSDQGRSRGTVQTRACDE